MREKAGSSGRSRWWCRADACHQQRRIHVLYLLACEPGQGLAPTDGSRIARPGHADASWWALGAADVCAQFVGVFFWNAASRIDGPIRAASHSSPAHSVRRPCASGVRGLHCTAATRLAHGHVPALRETPTPTCEAGKEVTSCLCYEPAFRDERLRLQRRSLLPDFLTDQQEERASSRPASLQKKERWTSLRLQSKCRDARPITARDVMALVPNARVLQCDESSLHQQVSPAFPRYFGSRYNSHTAAETECHTRQHDGG